ncbi:MAG: NosD domain-containing protein [Flavobacteriales bacterium]
MRSTTTFLAAVLLVVPSWATLFHVAPQGDDQASGQSLASAWATLQRAADVALAGDTVLVQPGTYQGFAAMDHSGSAASPIVFKAADDGVIIQTPCAYNDQDGINVENVSWVVVEGFEVIGMPRAGIRTALSDHVVIRGNTCTNNGKWGILTGFAEHCTIEQNTCSGSVLEHGIYFSNSADDPIIRHNHCFDNRANGIHMNGDVSLGGDGVIANAQVYGNVIHGNGSGGGSGINCDGVRDSWIHGNLLYDNHASGISLYRIDGGGPSVNNKVYNNTIVNAADARWCVNITEGCTGNQLVNNILINQHPFRGSIVVDATALLGFTSDHNLVMERLSPDGDATILDLPGWQAMGYDLNSQVAQVQAALFIEPGSDFRAVAPDAQQVDAGSAVVAPVVTMDLDGTPRPQGSGYDIGCYEAAVATALAAVTVRQAAEVRTEVGAIVVLGLEEQQQVKVFDLTGRVHFNGRVEADDQRITVGTPGVYLVQVGHASQHKLATSRVFVP